MWRLGVRRGPGACARREIKTFLCHGLQRASFRPVSLAPPDHQSSTSPTVKGLHRRLRRAAAAAAEGAFEAARESRQRQRRWTKPSGENAADDDWYEEYDWCNGDSDRDFFRADDSSGASFMEEVARMRHERHPKLLQQEQARRMGEGGSSDGGDRGRKREQFDEEADPHPKPW